MQTTTRPTDTDPTTPGGASARPWHAQIPDGCRRCGRTDHPHEGRGLCTLCWAFLRRHGGLWRYPVLYGGAAPGNANKVGTERLPLRAVKWQRQRAIHERAWADGRPWLTDTNCTMVAREPEQAPPARDLVTAETAPSTSAHPFATAETAPSTSAHPFATAEERRAAQLRWAEEDRRKRQAARRRTAA